jgi:hypothetical protein
VRRPSTLLALGLFALTRAAAADTTLTLDGTLLDDGVDHVRVPFEVPAGTQEVEIAHDDLSDVDILDFGLDDPNGFRGWGGGNSENAVVGALAASRSYLAGPLPAGTWNVVIGKAKLVEGSADYHLVVTLRDAPTLAPQPERTPYVPSPPLSSEKRWYAGDFHVHSIESGDARPPLDEVASFARTRGLDFVELSDHNTVSQLDFLVSAQAAHPDLLLLPGVEYTTYDGHANGIGATVWVDHKIGQPGVDIAGAAAAFRAQGALFAINHPKLDLGSQCIGCAWKHTLSPDAIDAVEIATSGANAIFGQATFAFWEELCDSGRHVVAIAGSDDHGAGQDPGAFGTPIGTPATYVLADGLSAAAIVEGVRAGRTVVKLGGTGDPMIELGSAIEPEGDTVHAESTLLRVTIRGGAGLAMAWVKNGKRDGAVDIPSDPFVVERRVVAPATGEDRYRVEVHRDGDLTTTTSYLWLGFLAGVGVPEVTPQAEESGCGCAVVGSAAEEPWIARLGVWVALGAAAFLRRRGGRGPDGRTADGLVRGASLSTERSATLPACSPRNPAALSPPSSP